MNKLVDNSPPFEQFWQEFTLVAFEFGDSTKLGCSQKISKRGSIKVFSITEELNSLDLDFRF